MDEVRGHLSTINRILESHDLHLPNIDKHGSGVALHLPNIDKHGSGSSTGEESLVPNMDQSTSGSGVLRSTSQSSWTSTAKQEPLSLLKICEQFLHGHKVMEEDILWLASYHMIGNAQCWNIHFEEEEGEPSWPHFSERGAPQFHFGLTATNLHHWSW
ncbi:hypothetical protein OsI_15380 [Oryza sativa Indica Group]|uniref:OSJNBa0008A08.1 protein n=4 Tax=Oryza TaxID=4527 RepID=A3ASG5_ORYSJ|nr:hypothetical protein OsI_15380 [Oryza sativa Indica Group]EAZ30254.1 hypothetical protein OsJ_14304 [Oryza sativa Japonica Group]CAE01593.1 OSJNBa0008A08.1 [Oryza sativa Japonica Group]CAE05221.3 OSJNBa0011K22.3 [Oryza sativa Japonica Group]CAE75960.1 B1159F04.23 [Oryza sativa Japonica Group]